jgi:hypothetical protein
MSDVSIIQMKEEEWLKNWNWNKKNWPFFFLSFSFFYLFSCSSISFFFFSGLLFEKMITTGFLSSRQVEVGTFQSGCVNKHDDGKLSSLFTRVSGSCGVEKSRPEKKKKKVNSWLFLFSWMARPNARERPNGSFRFPLPFGYEWQNEIEQ